MAEDIGLFEAIETMRAIRSFKPDAVPDELLRKVLAAAGQAPSGGNRQPWRFVVIRSAASKEKLRELLHIAEERSGDSAFADRIASAPAIIIVCAQRPARTGPFTVGPFGQTYPAVQNLLLAARGVGLGSTITTAFKWADDGFRAWLGLPDDMDPTCLVPIGFPDTAAGERHGRKTRRPVEELAYEEHWGQPVRF